jgi:hypothetical protein
MRGASANEIDLGAHKRGRQDAPSQSGWWGRRCWVLGWVFWGSLPSFFDVAVTAFG